MSDYKQADVAAIDARRIMRIARALAEGCDGSPNASDDAKILHRKYVAWKKRSPGLAIAECRVNAFCEFITETLAEDGSQ